MRLPQELLDRINSADLKEQMKAQRENLASNKIENVLPVAVRWMAYGWLAWVGIDVYRFLMSDIVRPIWNILKSVLTLISVLVVVLALFFPSSAQSASYKEDAATDLESAGKLHCHRSLHTTEWINTNDPIWNNAAHHETDQDSSDTTLCGARADGWAIAYIESWTPSVVEGLGGFNALQTFGRFGAYTHDAAASGTVPSGSGRVGMRFYRWQDSSQFCEEGKFAQVQTYWSYSGSLGGPIIYGADASTLPGSSTSAFANKWWRWELYFNGGFDSPTSADICLTNVTDGTPELCRTGITSGLWTGGVGANEPIHEFRDRQEDSSETNCTTRHMFLLVGKNLGAGERMPVAEELEGEQPPQENPGGSVRIARMGTFLLMGLILVATVLHTVKL